MQLPPFDRDAARTLIKEKADAPFTAHDIASRAHHRQSRKRHAEAALLFCLAAERANGEATQPNQAMNHLVRAGIAFNRAADASTAEPLLRQAIAFDWAAHGLANDQHMVEWAYFQLLLNAQSNAERFAALFNEAVARCAAIGRFYTLIHPHQEELLDIALALAQRDIVQRLAGQIADRRPGKASIKALLARARTFLRTA